MFTRSGVLERSSSLFLNIAANLLNFALCDFLGLYGLYDASVRSPDSFLVDLKARGLKFRWLCYSAGKAKKANPNPGHFVPLLFCFFSRFAFKLLNHIRSKKNVQKMVHILNVAENRLKTVIWHSNNVRLIKIFPMRHQFQLHLSWDWHEITSWQPPLMEPIPPIILKHIRFLRVMLGVGYNYRTWRKQH